MTIWFASGNTHKKAEMTAILNNHGTHEYNVLIPADAGMDFDPEETGTSFHENALLKARALYALLEQYRPNGYLAGDPIIADDSGICVDALDGRPGIYSARYTGRCNDYTGRCNDYTGKQSGAESPHSIGKKLTAAERNALLLEELGNNPHRSARFVCAMALMFSADRFFLAQETSEGEIVSSLQAAKGMGGFGYDPIFFIPSFGRTMAELSEEEKNAISHRGKAGKIIAAMLEVYN